ncbi:MAG: hypothetical protein FWF90_17350 [Promicromonosporaceae bacterium]|nr:hypothetical protein [Promicromonosporaceae bacterium]
MNTVYAPTGPARYGLNTAGPKSNATTELNAMATPADGVAKTGGLLSPSNPLFWFGVVAAVTLGLASVSTSVRAGDASAAFKVGK